MADTLLWIILIILTADFLLERVLSFLNMKRWSPEVPAEVAGIYDEARYGRSQLYLLVNEKFSLLLSSLTFSLTMALLVFGFFGWLDAALRSFTTNQVFLALLYFGILGLVADLLSIPFDLYHTFSIEARFGFNKTTLRTWILDKLKSWLLALIIGGTLVSLIVWLYLNTGNWFFLLAWGVIAVFMVFMAMFYTSVILPLFNKLSILEEGDLKEAIEQFCRQAGFRLKDIYLMDASKRSTKANAFFSGLGPKKSIVLYDTIIEKHSVPELVAILAHEVGHYKKKHVLLGMISALISSGLMMFVLSLLIASPELSMALGAEVRSFHVGLLAFGILFTPVSLLLGLITGYLSRRYEYAADRYAGTHYRPEALSEALIRLSADNLSNLRPHPLYVIFHHSHPPLLQRLKALQTLQPEENTGRV